MKKEVKSLILIFLILSSLFLEISGISTMMGSSYAYIIKPMFWIFLGVITFIFFKNEIIINMKYKKDVSFVVIIAILIYLLLYFGLGYVKGFAYNPYDSSLRGILTNLWTFIPMIIVREYARYFLINNCNKKNILWWTLFISLIFVFVEVNISKWDSYFDTPLTILKFFMESFVPSLITNLFLTYICYYAEYPIAILYVLIPQLIMYILPILPDIDLIMLAILNSTIPFFTYIYLNYMINKIDKTLNRKKGAKTMGIKEIIIMAVIVVLMVGFGIGILPYQPLVIASDSMSPKIHRGDIVIIKDTDVKKVKEGEIIRYEIDGYYVVHRVITINKDSTGNRTFITKGDNNDDIDLYPVKENQFAGTIKFKISYLGWPTLIFREIINNNIDDEVIVDKGRVN